MIYEPLSLTCKTRLIDKEFDRQLRDTRRRYAQQNHDLLKDHAEEMIKIRKEYNIAKQKR